MVWGSIRKSGAAYMEKKMPEIDFPEIVYSIFCNSVALGLEGPDHLDVALGGHEPLELSNGEVLLQGLLGLGPEAHWAVAGHGLNTC